MDPSTPDSEPPGDWFTTTHWSLVVAAQQHDATRSQQALAVLCERYWSPLYAYVRRSGHSVHDAQDLTQQFFAQLLDKNSLQVADRQRGRFRSFLLASLKHFLANQHKAARSQKRGGGRKHFSCDFSAAEAAFQAEPADHSTPERLFELRWALLLLDQVLARLEEEYSTADKSERFRHLKGFLMGDRDDRPYRDVAEMLGLNEAAVKMAVHRLRRRYREILREEIAQTVADPAEVDDELQQLFSVLAGKNG